MLRELEQQWAIARRYLGRLHRLLYANRKTVTGRVLGVYAVFLVLAIVFQAVGWTVAAIVAAVFALPGVAVWVAWFLWAHTRRAGSV